MRRAGRYLAGPRVDGPQCLRPRHHGCRTSGLGHRNGPLPLRSHSAGASPRLSPPPGFLSGAGAGCGVGRGAEPGSPWAGPAPAGRSAALRRRLALIFETRHRSMSRRRGSRLAHRDRRRAHCRTRPSFRAWRALPRSAPSPNSGRRSASALTSHWPPRARASTSMRGPPGRIRRRYPRRYYRRGGGNSARLPAPDWRWHYAVETSWDYYAAGDRWSPLTGVVDETRALSLSGGIGFDAPPTAGPEAHVIGGPRPDRFFIRCRIAGGTYDKPPTLARIAHQCGSRQPFGRTSLSRRLPPEAAAGPRRTIGWHSARSCRTARGYSSSPPPVRMRAGARWRILIAAAPGITIMSSIRRLESCGSAMAARAACCPPMRFSASIAGWAVVPTASAAGSLDRWLDNPHNEALVVGWSAFAPAILIEQPFSAFGGAAAESPEDAQARAVLALELPDKAVNIADFERLARATPGTPVARAWALPEFHPALPSVAAAGSVGVVVVPDGPGPAPVATPALVRAVKAYLAPRRLVTTEIHVIPGELPHSVGRCRAAPGGDRRARDRPERGARDARRLFAPVDRRTGPHRLAGRPGCLQGRDRSVAGWKSRGSRR